MRILDFYDGTFSFYELRYNGILTRFHYDGYSYRRLHHRRCYRRRIKKIKGCVKDEFSQI